MGEGEQSFILQGMNGNKLTPVARKLRQNGPEAEKRLWAQLRNRQLCQAKFVRQFPVGNAVCDFACRQAKLVIELDGGQHSENAADKIRDTLLEEQGYRIIRFWNNDVFDNLDGVLQAIQNALQEQNSRKF